MKPDEPITIDLLHEALTLLAKEWSEEMTRGNRIRHEILKEVSEIACWYCIGFCVAMRGEEETLIELAGTRESMRFLDNPPPSMVPHFEVVLAGPTKNRRVVGNKIRLPIAALTEGTEIPAGLWMKRYMKQIEKTGRRSGPLFQRKLLAPKVFEFESSFYRPLETIKHARPDLISRDISVREDFGILRSLRRGSNAHAINMRVDREVVNAINQWRREWKAGAPSADLQERYSRLDALKPTLLRYSRAL